LVSIAGMMALALVAGDDGCPSQTAVDGIRIAALPESRINAEVCAHYLPAGREELTFEIIPAHEAHDSAALVAQSREVVDFDWNPGTGELSYRTTTATRIFNDLEDSIQRAALSSSRPVARCE